MLLVTGVSSTALVWPDIIISYGVCDDIFVATDIWALIAQYLFGIMDKHREIKQIYSYTD